MSLHDLHRPLGNTGLIVSPLGLGTVKLGRDQGVKYPNGFTIPDDAAARELVTRFELPLNRTIFPRVPCLKTYWPIPPKTFANFRTRACHVARK